MFAVVTMLCDFLAVHMVCTRRCARPCFSESPIKKSHEHCAYRGNSHGMHCTPHEMIFSSGGTSHAMRYISRGTVFPGISHDTPKRMAMGLPMRSHGKEKVPQKLPWDASFFPRELPTIRAVSWLEFPPSYWLTGECSQLTADFSRVVDGWGQQTAK